MKSCRAVTELLSKSLEQPLPIGQRMALKLHLAMCSVCQAWWEQIKEICQASQYFRAAVEEGRLVWPGTGEEALRDDERRAMQAAIDHAAQSAAPSS